MCNIFTTNPRIRLHARVRSKMQGEQKSTASPSGRYTSRNLVGARKVVRAGHGFRGGVGR